MLLPCSIKNCNIPNLLTYTLQIVTSNNMAQEEHIGLIYNSMGCCSIWNYTWKAWFPYQHVIAIFQTFDSNLTTYT